MQPPPYGPPPGPPPGTDRTALFGWLGIPIGLICCWPAGVVLGALSIWQARKYGSSPTLGYVAIGLSVLNLVVSLIYLVAIRN
jgi:hypothetical protein